MNKLILRLRRSFVALTATIGLVIALGTSEYNTANAQQVFAGPDGYSACAIDANGNLYTWGIDQYLHPVVNKSSGSMQDFSPVKVAFPAGVTSWKSAAVGNFFNLALGNDGNVYAWGLNTSGQLGDGTKTNDSALVKVHLPSGVTATAICAGTSFGLAIGSDGNVYAWGTNSPGLGSGTTSSTTPVKVGLPAGVTASAIAAGPAFGLAIGNDGNIYGWGGNGYGQLGNGTKTNSSTPVVANLPTGVTAKVIAAGSATTMAICSDGNIYEWGSNSSGQVGNGTMTSPQLTPAMVRMPTGVTAKAIAGGRTSSLAIGSNGILYQWGDNLYGEAGNDSLGVPASVDTPTAVILPSGMTPTSITAIRWSDYAVGNDNVVYSWGYNQEGELGVGIATGSPTYGIPTPTVIPDFVFSQPGVPVLASPLNNAANQPAKLVLVWNKAPNAAGYQCQVSLDPTFATNIVVNDSISTDTTDTVSGLGASTKYFWQVRSYTNGVFSGFSNVDSFNTIMAAPSSPVLVFPANGATGEPFIETLRCSKTAGAAQYHWQVSNNAAFSTFMVNDTTVDTLNVVTLSSGMKYYWQVQAINPGGASAFVGPDSFTVMTAPSVPIPALPANNAAYVRPDTLVLKWHSVSTASGYAIELSDSLSFSHMVVSQDSIADTMFTVTSLKNLQKYYWRVRAYNAGGPGAYSAAYSFTTIESVPATPVLTSPASSTTGVPRRATLEWNATTLATKYHVEIATALQIYTSGDSIGAFLAQNVVFDTTVADTSLQLFTPLTENTKYYWHVSGVDTAGMGSYSSPFVLTTGTGILAIDQQVGIPKTFALLQNYPNPFNPSTTIKYSLPKAQMVTLRVYNVLGQKVATLVDARQNAGYYEVNFDADRFASGVYFYILRTERFTAVHKMLFLK